MQRIDPHLGCTKAFMDTRKRVVENDLRLKRHNIIRQMMKIQAMTPRITDRSCSPRSIELESKHNHKDMEVNQANCEACRKITPEIIVLHKGERISASPLGSNQISPAIE